MACYRWSTKAGRSGRDTRAHGVYVEEPRLLPETLSASMTEGQKFGMATFHPLNMFMALCTLQSALRRRAWH